MLEFSLHRKKDRETEEVIRVKNNGDHVTLPPPDWPWEPVGTVNKAAIHPCTSQ